MARAIEQLRQAMEACELGALSLPDQVDSLMDAGKAVLQEVSTLTPPNEALSVLVDDEPDQEYIDYICPRCKSIISQRRRGQRMETVYKCKFHDNCGQRVDWSNPQPYRRPPEGEEDT